MLRSRHYETRSPCPAQHRGLGPSGMAMNCIEWLKKSPQRFILNLTCPLNFNQPSGLASNFHLWNQDPTVFEGTIRFNIDPFDEFPDARLWEAVQSVQLMPYIRTLAVTWPLVALSDGMSWEGTHRTSKYSKCIKMYKFYQLPSFYIVTCLNLCSIQQILFRKDWNPKATVPPVTNATVIVVEARPPDSRAPPCPLFRSPQFQGWHRHIYRTWWLQHQFWTEAIVEPRTWQSCKDVFFFSPVFLFLCHIWSVNLVLNMKNAREARPVTVSCPAILLFCLVFSGRQFSWTKAWWCGNLQYSFWMNVPQPWILSHRKRHRKPSWRISPGADDGWGSIVLKKSAAFWTSNFWGYPGIPMNTTSTRSSVDLPHGCWIGLYFFGCRTTTIAVAHRLVACLEWSIYCSWMLLLQYERKKCRSFMWPLSWFHSVLGCLGLTPGCPFRFWTCCDIWIWLPGLRWHIGHFGDLRKQSWTLTRSWYSKGAPWSNRGNRYSCLVASL